MAKSLASSLNSRNGVARQWVNKHIPLKRVIDSVEKANESIQENPRIATYFNGQESYYTGDLFLGTSIRYMTILRFSAPCWDTNLLWPGMLVSQKGFEFGKHEDRVLEIANVIHKGDDPRRSALAAMALTHYDWACRTDDARGHVAIRHMPDIHSVDTVLREVERQHPEALNDMIAVYKSTENVFAGLNPWGNDWHPMQFVPYPLLDDWTYFRLGSRADFIWNDTLYLIRTPLDEGLLIPEELQYILMLGILAQDYNINRVGFWFPRYQKRVTWVIDPESPNRIFEDFIDTRTSLHTALSTRKREREERWKGEFAQEITGRTDRRALKNFTPGDNF